jgi:homoserine dehydrogenase
VPREHRIAILGLGNVGRSLLAHLDAHPDPDLTIVAAADSTGLIWNDEGFTPRALLQAKAHGGVDALAEDAHHYVGDLARSTARFEYDALIDLLPADYRTGGVSRRILLESLTHGIPTITADKAPLALDSASLFAAARRHATPFEYTATVGGGLPVVPVLRDGLAVGVQSLEGILNGTTNHILSQVERGQNLKTALAEAQRLGIAEADPRNDLEGFDAAAKGVILHNTAFDTHLTVHDVAREALDAKAAQEAQDAYASGKRLRSVVTVRRGHVEVAFRHLEADDPLVADGAACICLIKGEPATTLRLFGPGYGVSSTAYAALRDLGRIRRAPIRGLAPMTSKEVLQPVIVS